MKILTPTILLLAALQLSFTFPTFSTINTAEEKITVNHNIEFHEGEVVRLFRVLNSFADLNSINELPKYVNVRDLKTGKTYKSLPLDEFVREGERVKFIIKGDKIKVIEQSEDMVMRNGVIMQLLDDNNDEAKLGLVRKTVSIKDSETGQIIQSSPLIKDFRTGQEVKYMSYLDKVFVMD